MADFKYTMVDNQILAMEQTCLKETSLRGSILGNTGLAVTDMAQADALTTYGRTDDNAQTHAGCQDEQAARIVRESGNQHDCNVALFERALDGAGKAAQLNITVEDALWALSHVRKSRACERLQESARLQRPLHCAVAAEHLNSAVVDTL